MQMSSHNYQEAPPSKERVGTTQKLGGKRQTSLFPGLQARHRCLRSAGTSAEMLIFNTILKPKSF